MEILKKSNILKNSISNDSSVKFKHTITVLWSIIMVLMIILTAVVYSTVSLYGHLKKININAMALRSGAAADGVSYENDKIYYKPDELIKLNIVNNSKESIYLAPCQYFNKFEKKVSGLWQPVSIIACDTIEVSSEKSLIEKVSRKAEDSILAKNLGSGIWRGVSNVYYGCQKARVESCKNKQVIYTNEFIVGEPELAAFSNMQL